MVLKTKKMKILNLFLLGRAQKGIREKKNYLIVGLNTGKIMFVYKQLRHRGLVEKKLKTCLIALRKTEISSVGPKTSPCGSPLSKFFSFHSNF